MEKWKVCGSCHIAFKGNNNVCPSCGKTIVDENKRANCHKEGDGRKHGAGGDACNYCPHCYGNANWCPLMDND